MKVDARVVSALGGTVMLLVGMLVLAVRYETYSATTNVMAPAIRIGEIALVDPAAANASHPQRGDVVLADGAKWPGVPAGQTFVVRVVAVSGDRIACCDSSGAMLLNGQPLREPYAWGANDVFGQFDIVIPDNRIFVLGDERDRSRDSRELLSPAHVHADHVHDNSAVGDAAHATLAASDTLGTVLMVVSPPWRLRTVTPAPLTSPHIFGLAAIGLGALLLLVVTLPTVGRFIHRRYRQIRRKRSEAW